MSARDINANVNSFINVPVHQNGSAKIEEGISIPGDFARADQASSLFFRTARNATFPAPVGIRGNQIVEWIPESRSALQSGQDQPPFFPRTRLRPRASIAESGIKMALAKINVCVRRKRFGKYELPNPGNGRSVSRAEFLDRGLLPGKRPVANETLPCSLFSDVKRLRSAIDAGNAIVQPTRDQNLTVIPE
jgi:hypothetical protein